MRAVIFRHREPSANVLAEHIAAGGKTTLHDGYRLCIVEYMGLGRPGRNWYPTIDRARVFNGTGHAKTSLQHFKPYPWENVLALYVQPVQLAPVLEGHPHQYSEVGLQR